MIPTTLKLTSDCDYLVYLDQGSKPIGFELTGDEKQALALRYHSADLSCEPTIPEQAIYVLEVVGIPSTLVWRIVNGKGDLLFYKPKMLPFVKAIYQTLCDAVEIMDYEPHKTMSKYSEKDCHYHNNGQCQINGHAKCLFNKLSPRGCPDFELPPDKNLPAITITPNMTEEYSKELIAKLPFPNWMAVYYETPMWTKIWQARTDLQTAMAIYTSERANKEGRG